MRLEEEMRIKLLFLIILFVGSCVFFVFFLGCSVGRFLFVFFVLFFLIEFAFNLNRKSLMVIVQ